jgi:hypothetical protein
VVIIVFRMVRIQVPIVVISRAIAGRKAWLTTSWKKVRLKPGVSVVT